MILRRLRCDGIAHTIFRVEPESWRSLETAAQRNQKILSDVVRREAEFLSLCAVDTEVHVRLIERLLNSKIRCTRHVLDLLQQLACPRPVAFQVVPDDLNVDG